jgi:hypothetical protein
MQRYNGLDRTQLCPSPSTARGVASRLCIGKSVVSNRFATGVATDDDRGLPLWQGSCYQVLPNRQHQPDRILILKEMVSAEGIESTLKQQTKQITEHSWQCKAL